MDWDTLIMLGHIVGTVLGVGGATFAEIFHSKVTRDGYNETAGGFLHITYMIMRIGLILLVISGFGFLLLARFEGQTQYIYSARVWAKLMITLIILVNTALLHIRKMPTWLGSAISITSWYAALIIGAWRIRAGFWTLILAYLIVIIVVAAYKHSKSLQGVKQT